MPENPSTSTQPPTGPKIFTVLWKAFHALREVDQNSMRRLHMCPSDFAVLELLLHKGPMPVNTIGKKVLLTSGSMTAAINRLERKGWVTRSREPRDRRIVLAALTPSGCAFISDAFADHAHRLEEAVASLDPCERSTLVTLLKKVGKYARNLNVQT